MAYQHDFPSFSFDGGMHPNILVHPRLQYAGFAGQPVQHDMVYAPYAFQDVYDQLPHGIYPEGYIDESNEPTTRPRLTPDQQAVLETQFLSNPKPSSATKKNLAQLTKLSPARVAVSIPTSIYVSVSLTHSQNWFQNRRAKAKQQRKQEEFENSQQQQQQPQTGSHSTQDQVEDDDEDDDDKQEEDEEYNKQELTDPRTDIWRQKPESSLSQTRNTQSVDVRELGYASLNRALAAAEAAQHTQSAVTQLPPALDEKFAMPPPEMPRQTALPQSVMPIHAMPAFPLHTTQSNWCTPQEVQPVWPSSPINASDMNFDFGFDTSVTQNLNESIDLTSPSNTTCSQTYGPISPDEWEAPMITPTMPVHPQTDFRQPLQSPCFPLPTYASSSRRPSIADSLTNNLEQIVLTANSGNASFPHSASVSPGTSDSGIGLAARRKRPGLAPLKGEALRSRSHGALTASASPTFRPGMTPPTAQPLRHSKSTGYSLNSQYAGVRKSSLPRKSPLAASFAESDFQKFMAHKMIDHEGHSQLTPINTTYTRHPSLPEQALAQFHAHQMPKHATQMAERPTRSQMASPPITPFQTDFFNGMHPASMMPSSIQAQYASTADWTPPYSAGPLTNSSLSDAPLTSPDFAHFSPFPPVQYIPSLSPATHGRTDEPSNHWLFSADDSPRPMALPNTAAMNKAADDFKINLYEFPNQKEAHAQATRQLPRAPQSHHNVFVHESANYFKDKSPKQ